jgi:hypothetical protein
VSLSLLVLKHVGYGTDVKRRNVKITRQYKNGSTAGNKEERRCQEINAGYQERSRSDENLLSRNVFSPPSVRRCNHVV